MAFIYVMLKLNLLNMFVETIIFSGFFDEYKREQHLFQIELFCINVKVFTVTFDQLLKKKNLLQTFEC